MLAQSLLGASSAKIPFVEERFAFPSTDTATSIGTFNITYTQTPNVGDWLVCFCRSTNSSGLANCNSTGWTRSYQSMTLEVLYRQATDSTKTFTFGVSAQCRLFFMLVRRGSYVATGGNQTTGSSSTAFSSPPTSSRYSLVVAAGTANNAVTNPAISPSYTNLAAHAPSNFLVTAWRYFDSGETINATYSFSGSEVTSCAAVIFTK